MNHSINLRIQYLNEIFKIYFSFEFWVIWRIAPQIAHSKLGQIRADWTEIETLQVQLTSRAGPVDRIRTDYHVLFLDCPVD